MAGVGTALIGNYGCSGNGSLYAEHLLDVGLFIFISSVVGRVIAFGSLRWLGSTPWGLLLVVSLVAGAVLFVFAAAQCTGAHEFNALGTFTLLTLVYWAAALVGANSPTTT